MMVFISSIFSNMVWLLFRSCASNVVDVEPDRSLMNEKTDHLECNMILMGFLEMLITPAFVSWVLLNDTDFITIESAS